MAAGAGLRAPAAGAPADLVAFDQGAGAQVAALGDLPERFLPAGGQGGFIQGDRQDRPPRCPDIILTAWAPFPLSRKVIPNASKWCRTPQLRPELDSGV